jgi:hypothetical protein
MARTDAEQRFTDALQALMDRYDEARRLRAVAAAAQAELSQALAISDDVRRAARSGRSDRPDDGDCAQLAAVTTRLAALVENALARPEVAALWDAIANDRREAASTHAAAVFSAVERDADPPEFAYLPVSLRSRERNGETLLHPQTLAGRIKERLASALTAPSQRGPSESALPEPLLLSPSVGGCGSEIAIRIPTRDLQLLRHVESGDWWMFGSSVSGPFAVAMAAEASDEWWAASPISYPAYTAALRETLGTLGIDLVVAD